MKKLTSLFFALVMIFSIAFISESISSSHNPFAAQAQVTVRKKRRPGIARRTYRGGKYVVRRTWDGTKWVSKKTWKGTKWVGRKTYKTGRKVVSRTKKIVY